jgi:hypothetical protein
MSDWLNKLLAADDNGNNWTKLLPLLIFFVIWVVGAISKAAQKGKKGTEAEPEEPSEVGGEPSFDDLAKKIRERYTQAKEEAMKQREVQQGAKPAHQPPARPPKPIPSPRPTPSITRPEYPARPKPPLYEVNKTPSGTGEGPTLRVVKGLEKPAVNASVSIEKPILRRVESGLEKVEGITSDVPMVSTGAGPKQPHYLTELVEQYSTTDGFRKAILNYEILGPPVGLR